MAIFLTVLKIIGIVLLSIIGLVILILLIVLFSPISYRVCAEHNEQNTMASAKIRFLLMTADSSFKLGEGFKYSVKLLFFKIYPRGDTPQEKDVFEVELPDEEDFLAIEGEENSDENMTSNESGRNSESKQEISEDSAAISDDNSGETSTEMSTETKGSETEDSGESENSETEASGEAHGSDDKETADESGQKTGIKDKAVKTVDGLMDKADEILDKTDEKLDALDKKQLELSKKLDHVYQFLERDYVQKTIKRSLKIIKRFFGTIKPKKSKGYIHYGLNSSADTGMILGKFSMFYPLYGRWLVVEPDFYNKVIEGNMDVRGHIFLFRFVFPVIGMILTPSFWKTIKLAKKI